MSHARKRQLWKWLPLGPVENEVRGPTQSRGRAGRRAEPLSALVLANVFGFKANPHSLWEDCETDAEGGGGAMK